MFWVTTTQNKNDIFTGSNGSFHSEQKSIDLLEPQGSKVRRKPYEPLSDQTSSASEEHLSIDGVDADNGLENEANKVVTSFANDFKQTEPLQLLESGDQLILPLPGDALSSVEYKANSEGKVDAWLKNSLGCDERNGESDAEMAVSLLDPPQNNNGPTDRGFDLVIDDVSIESD